MDGLDGSMDGWDSRTHHQPHINMAIAAMFTMAAAKKYQRYQGLHELRTTVSPNTWIQGRDVVVPTCLARARRSKVVSRPVGVELRMCSSGANVSRAPTITEINTPRDASYLLLKAVPEIGGIRARLSIDGARARGSISRGALNFYRNMLFVQRQQ